MPVNTLLSGLTGQRYSGCFLYMVHRFPSANIFHSGISRPAISRRPIFLYRANFSLLFAITFHQGAFGAGLNLMASNLSLSFSISFHFLFFIFLLFLFHSLLTPSSSNIPNFYFSVFFCGFLHEKTGRITAAGKSGVIDGLETQSTSGEGEHRFTESFSKFLCKFFCVFFCHITLNGNLIHPGVPG